jgi:serine/threonine-protein kinase RsbT
VISAPQEAVPIGTTGDVVRARQVVRTAAEGVGFGLTDVTRIVTAASELARNTLHHAGSGLMRCGQVDGGGRPGIEIIFEDQGPGIANIDQAMEDGFSTGGGLGKGLPGAKRLMDEMEIDSEVGRGTTVILRKWLRS